MVSLVNQYRFAIGISYILSDKYLTNHKNCMRTSGECLVGVW